jgi:signal transduction histidine kinase
VDSKAANITERLRAGIEREKSLWRRERTLSASEAPLRDREAVAPEGVEGASLWGRVREANEHLVVAAVNARNVADDALAAGAKVKAKLNARLTAASARARRMEKDLDRHAQQISDLGSRLLTAQEDERARIARELHDDISQQLALVSIELQQLETSGLLRGDADARVHNTWMRTQVLLRSVHNLSHRLHPANLELLGLIPALERLQKEMSPLGVAISLFHHDVPETIPLDIKLCLFRIVQEGLQNAINHSGAREVSVDLAVGPSGLSLHIVDEGIGFDVEAAEERGLGLRSMRERLGPLNGRLSVYSAPGIGTRLEVTVPLRTRPSNTT